jgi:hypothetical protein
MAEHVGRPSAGAINLVDGCNGRRGVAGNPGAEKAQRCSVACTSRTRDRSKELTAQNKLPLTASIDVRFSRLGDGSELLYGVPVASCIAGDKPLFDQGIRNITTR